MARDSLTYFSNIISVYTSWGGYCMYEENWDEYIFPRRPSEVAEEIELGPKVIVEWSK